jgi:hypothetical protein
LKPVIASEAKQSSLPLWLWIASWSLSSGARSRDPLARNDEQAEPWVSQSFRNTIDAIQPDISAMKAVARP